MKINTDPQKIEEFLTRGVENIYPNIDFLRKKLLGGKKLKIYLGVDPTGPTLHMGHAIVLKKLSEFQKLGHQVILLIGDFTAMIGDPTDKAATRKQLTRKQVLNNCKLYKKQASIFLDFGFFSGAKLKYNSKWLGKMNFADVLSLASKMTVEQMAKRDMFQKRTEEGKPVYIHEFMYPLMQGYDSVAMGVDGEIGGNDQTFNMLTGRDLMKEICGKEKFVIATKLLVDPNGKKMGKTEGNMITLEDNASDMFGKVMSWTDGMIIPGFELCTYVFLEEIDKIKQELLSGKNPRDIKVRLAKEIVTIYHNKEEADKAEQNFVNTFKEGGLPEKIDEVVVTNGELLSDVSLKVGLVKSKGEFRRLVLENAVSNQETGEKITDQNYKIISTAIYKIGKRRFLKVIVK
jgi:tyrosyl-tRNA synthetase